VIAVVMAAIAIAVYDNSALLHHHVRAADHRPHFGIARYRVTAFKERCKIHDVVMEGIGLALKKRGYPPIDDLKVERKR
jgi:hypothetical protein